MGLKLVKDTEKLVIEGEGWKWFYRRIGSTVYNAIVRRHTNRKGETNNYLVARETLIYATLGWEGFEELDGTPIVYSATNVEQVIDALPQSIQVQFFDAAFNENADRVAAELGNLPTTPVSNPQTTG